MWLDIVQPAWKMYRYRMFRNSAESHQHSLQTLNQLYEYDDFMASIETVADLGCGTGEDLVWWATRTVRGDPNAKLNINCQGIDILGRLPIAAQYHNITYQRTDFEGNIYTSSGKFDILWCHNAFQYAVNPFQTLIKWRDISSTGAMLALTVPQTTNIHQKDLDFTQHDGCYYHYTILNLIHMLAITGWDCKAGFFKKNPNDNWLHAIVYKSDHAPFNLKKTRLYDLVDAKLLPDSADKSILAKGFLDQKDLILPWLDKSLSSMRI
jgi:SAM-dependent methyltransferase